MAENPSNHINFLLEIDQEHLSDLVQIRSWFNLKIAHEGRTYWVKDFTQQQLESLEVKSIPFKKLYSLQNNLLFPYGSKLPSKRLPSALLWTPLERGLPVTLPAYNHNYFGLQEKIQVKLVPADIEQPDFGLVVSLATLSAYVQTAPAIRLQNLSWLILKPEAALVLGTPLLPVPGRSYWQRGSHLLPTGYDFELPVLQEVIQQKINPEQEEWVFWQPNGSYSFITKAQFRPLTISSVRLSVQSASVTS
ncbi:hypothetical protein [Rufibacter hautae]|uniref:MoxR-vWA-beta-propeller ternary system domain-containing protein n=1 Tax=Rufibacter hautae TaxID=2595005 RepID=A0A5B6TMH8_9BACT|nr:hypothetical protein [Rufibacter hautae]KAA3440710.1 hypothetical protein FOA19_08695 [Rufibacter hautae]